MSLLLALVGAGEGEGGGEGGDTGLVTGAGAPGAHKRKRGEELQRFLDELVMASMRESIEPEPEPEAPRAKVYRVKLPVHEFERIPPRRQLPVMRSFAEDLARSMQDAERRARLKAAMEAAIRQAQEDDDEEALVLLI